MVGQSRHPQSAEHTGAAMTTEKKFASQADLEEKKGSWDKLTDKPIKYVVLTHYHAVRVLGASGYKNEGLEQIIASRDTYDLIVERGQQDMDSEIGRFPRLFQAVESVPGLTWPTLAFQGEMTLWLGKLEVRIAQLGRGHTKGDTIVHLPSQNICFSGDLVEFEAACYTGDAYLADWPQTLDRSEEHTSE